MKRFINMILILSIVFIPFFGNTKVQALSDVKFSLVPDKLSVVEDEEVNVSVMVSCKENINISAFRMRVSFDSSKFVYKNIYSAYSTSDFKTYEKLDLLTILYVTRERGINLDANSNVCLFEFNFKSTCDSAIGASTFSAEVDGLCNYDCIELPCAYIDSINISKVNSEPANCNLSDLVAVNCTLSPPFSSDITKYSINVPYSKSSIEFITTSEDPEASVKVSRKTLNSAGKSTDINITVTSPDKKTKKVYTVTVNRGIKDSSSSSDSKNSSKSSSKSSSKNSSKSSAKGNSSKNKNSDSLNENLAVTDSQNKSTLVVKENNFNFLLFFTVSLVVVIILIFIIKNKKVGK